MGHHVPTLLQSLDWTADGSSGKYRAFLVDWANRVLTNLERWFSDRQFVATNDFTVADILVPDGALECNA
jgi:glutathione S-transferase